MRIILRDYKYLDALKMTNINTLYDRGELLFLKLFNEISHTIDHKLASLLAPSSDIDIPICKGIVTRSVLLLAIFVDLVCFQFFKCLLIFSINSFIRFYISTTFLVIFLFIDKLSIVMYFITRNSAERLQAVHI